MPRPPVAVAAEDECGGLAPVTSAGANGTPQAGATQAGTPSPSALSAAANAPQAGQRTPAGPSRPGQQGSPAAGATPIPAPTQVTAADVERLRAVTRTRFDELRQIDEELLAAAARLRDAEDQLAQVTADVAALEVRVQAQQVAVDQRAAVYGSRLRALYKFTRFSPLEQLLAAQDFSDLLRRATLIQAVVRVDQVLLRQLRAEYDALVAAREALREKQQQAAALRDEIAQQESTLADRRADLAAAAEQAQQEEWQAEAALFQVQESSTAASIVTLQVQFQPAIDALERQQAADARQAAPAPPAPAAAPAGRAPTAGLPGAPAVAAVPPGQVGQPGQPARPPSPGEASGSAPLPAVPAIAPAPVFAWPVMNAVVTTEFGEPTFAQSAHTGIDLAQRRLEPILAAADGVVMACGLAVPGEPEQSYGMMIVIAHSRTIATLYAHLENEVAPPVVTPGQVVKRGQIIGYIGMTGLTTGPHLHFEVRVAGQCQNPRDFLPAA